MHISLRAGEKIYINGAVLRADRKVSIELLNDVSFLLESHVLQPQDAHTPLQHLYFVVQTMLIEPGGTPARAAFAAMLPAVREAYDEPRIVAGLGSVGRLVADAKMFDALKVLRGLFPLETAILSPGGRDGCPATRAA